MSEFAVTEDHLLLAARQHLRARRWREADTLATGWLAKNSRSVLACALRGLVCLGGGQLEAARGLIETAASAGPDQAFACLALARLYLAEEKSVEAETALRRTLALAPREVEAACLLAFLRSRAGDAPGAERLLRQALAAAPQDTTVCCALAELLIAGGQTAEAAQLLDRALAGDAQAPTVWLLRAQLLARRADFAAAADCIEHALLAEPENPHYLVELARMQLCAGLSAPGSGAGRQLLAAEQAIRRALVLLPRAPQALLLLGGVLRAQGRFGEAVATLAEAIRANPEASPAVGEMALTQYEAGNPAAACLAAQRAATLSPGDPAMQILLVQMAMAAGRPAEAHAAQERADRLLRPAAGRRTAPLAPPSPGENTLLLVEHELPSAIFYARYLPALAAQGWQVRLALPARGKSLFATLPGVAEVIDIAEAGDLSTAEPLSRLPVLAGGADLETPWNGPYLFADAQRLAALRGRFAVMPGRRIGVNLGELSDSALAGSIAGLLKAAGAHAVLFGAAALASGHWRELGHEMAEVAEMADAAVWIQAVDEVITLTSPLAHLCGALGSPCHVLLPVDHETLWGAQAETTPWYPAMRLYRETRAMGWHGALAELTESVMCEDVKPATPPPRGEERPVREHG